MPGQLIDLALSATHPTSTTTRVLLHGDLYSENIPLALDRRPVFLDPLPMIGDVAFDWAFYVVYFDLFSDPILRLRAASQSSGLVQAELLPWCMTLCLDGFLYYHEVKDRRASRMAEVMGALAAEGRLV